MFILPFLFIQSAHQSEASRTQPQTINIRNNRKYTLSLAWLGIIRLTSNQYTKHMANEKQHCSHTPLLHNTLVGVKSMETGGNGTGSRPAPVRQEISWALLSRLCIPIVNFSSLYTFVVQFKILTSQTVFNRVSWTLGRILTRKYSHQKESPLGTNLNGKHPHQKVSSLETILTRDILIRKGPYSGLSFQEVSSLGCVLSRKKHLKGIILPRTFPYQKQFS